VTHALPITGQEIKMYGQLQILTIQTAEGRIIEQQTALYWAI